jgi:uncharacterized protein involved in high-affinity Fe2+ transport
VLRRWAAVLVTLAVVAGMAAIVVLNLDLKGPSSAAVEKGLEPAVVRPAGNPPAGFREYPIGEPVDVPGPHLRIAAVWLPPVQMEGMAGQMPADVIHLEADIHATEGNPNGFAKDEFIPYLTVGYVIEPAGGGPPLHKGELMPMVARDGLHYGASIEMPKAGSYRLTYIVKPPSAGGLLGRHSDPATGVAPWWKEFRVNFDWDYPGPPRS